MDDADSSLAGSLESLHHSLAGTDAGLGETGIMKVQNLRKSLSRGRGTYPLPLHPIPNNKTCSFTQKS